LKSSKAVRPSSTISTEPLLGGFLKQLGGDGRLIGPRGAGLLFEPGGSSTGYGDFELHR
jgi:hypothetical protein